MVLPLKVSLKKHVYRLWAKISHVEDDIKQLKQKFGFDPEKTFQVDNDVNMSKFNFIGPPSLIPCFLYIRFTNSITSVLNKVLNMKSSGMNCLKNTKRSTLRKPMNSFAASARNYLTAGKKLFLVSNLPIQQQQHAKCQKRFSMPLQTPFLNS